MTKIEEVLEYIRGNSYATNKEISEDLNISEGVVRTYLNRLKNKGVPRKDRYRIQGFKRNAC